MGVAATVIALASSGASSDDSSPRDERSGEIVITCESGIETRDGIETSSRVVERIPADAPIPDGCQRS